MTRIKIVRHLAFVGALSAGCATAPKPQPQVVLPPVKDCPAVLATATASVAPKNLRSRTTSIALGRIEFPLFSKGFEDTPIASVGDELIPLRLLNDALGRAHEGSTAGEGSGRPLEAPKVSAILDRLVNTRLLLLDARSAELDQLPEYQAEVESFRESRLRDALKKEVVSGLTPDPAKVEEAYKDLARQWKVRSVLFADETSAKRAKARITAGETFDAVTDALIKAGEASGGQPAEPLAKERLLPTLVTALASMQVGQVSDPLKVPRGFALMHLEELVYPENPTLRARAERAALEAQARQALESFVETLGQKLTKSDEKRIAALDLDAAKPGLEALTRDETVLIRIDGGPSITVGDVAKAIARKLFHRPDPSRTGGGRITKQKFSAIRSLLTERLVRLEAKNRGLDRTDEFRQATRDHADELLVSLFMGKVIVPTLKMTEEELREHYSSHQLEYSFPELYRLEAIAFPTQQLAEATLTKVRQGADFRWLRANAAGQLAPGSGDLEFPEGMVTGSSLPASLRTTLADPSVANAIHESPGGVFYVVNVAGRVPPKARPYEDVREEISNRVFGERLGKAIDAWADKLRAAYPVHIFLRGIGDGDIE